MLSTKLFLALDALNVDKKRYSVEKQLGYESQLNITVVVVLLYGKVCWE